MTTTHTPATPLPWIANDEWDEWITAEDQEQRIGRTQIDDDTAYIVHAANAYPRLVEALRDLEAIASRQFPNDSRSRAAHALLRSLGEAE